MHNKNALFFSTGNEVCHLITLVAVKIKLIRYNEDRTGLSGHKHNNVKCVAVLEHWII